MKIVQCPKILFLPMVLAKAIEKSGCRSDKNNSSLVYKTGPIAALYMGF
jgi:hypothetical protein